MTSWCDILVLRGFDCFLVQRTEYDYLDRFAYRGDEMFYFYFETVEKAIMIMLSSVSICSHVQHIEKWLIYANRKS